MPHANTLVATTQQLAAGLGVTAATLALRLGGTLDGRPDASYLIAFLLLALLPIGALAGVLRLSAGAGDVARRVRAVSAPCARPDSEALHARGHDRAID